MPTAARPAQPPRPGSGGQRVLVQVLPRPLPPHIRCRRRVATAIGTMVLTAMVVVLLGLLADAVAAARQGPAEPAPGGYSLTGVVSAPGQVSLRPLD